jgi:hypothetical protein
MFGMPEIPEMLKRQVFWRGAKKAGLLRLGAFTKKPRQRFKKN